MAVFLVVLVMTMVSAIGVFSMHSASLVDRATGFHRQNVQATAIVELGARGAATWLGPNKMEIQKATSNPASPRRDVGCNPALTLSNAEAPCWLIPAASLESQFLVAPDGLDGQLSSPHETATVIRTEFATEVTESFDANAAAVAGSGGRLVEVTFTTRSRIFPTDASTATSCGAATRGAVSQQRLRSHLIVQF
jgi:hypothetical protein